MIPVSIVMMIGGGGLLFLLLSSSIDFSFLEGVEGALVRRRTDVLPSKFCTVSIYICL